MRNRSLQGNGDKLAIPRRPMNFSVKSTRSTDLMRSMRIPWEGALWAFEGGRGKRGGGHDDKQAGGVVILPGEYFMSIVPSRSGY